MGQTGTIKVVSDYVKFSSYKLTSGIVEDFKGLILALLYNEVSGFINKGDQFFSCFRL